ncbi:hypothetical protein JWG45_16005 [Leptospira sp. 201903070]|uniref:SH3 domain-containing protein n=1 Tax=Leptospira ainlahdjerensis TaxID=2810033 RepID=A0ABS2UE50_9LEPT|nr:hypothetical protein [Leptospira ainlahdjerensis]MBM9578650.1 hypothetical protein [Leptospira ainlahdjerensis]
MRKLILLLIVIINCQMAQKEYRELTMTDDEKLAELNEWNKKNREKENVESEVIKKREQELEERRYPYEEERSEYLVKCRDRANKLVVHHAGIYDVRAYEPGQLTVGSAQYNPGGSNLVGAPNIFMDYVFTLIDKKTGEILVREFENVRCVYGHHRTGLWLINKDRPKGIFKKNIWINPEIKGKQFKDLN